MDVSDFDVLWNAPDSGHSCVTRHIGHGPAISFVEGGNVLEARVPRWL
jgi:hypothetical protein